jgi:hypothetical protein
MLLLGIIKGYFKNIYILKSKIESHSIHWIYLMFIWLDYQHVKLNVRIYITKIFLFVKS